MDKTTAAMIVIAVILVVITVYVDLSDPTIGAFR